MIIGFMGKKCAGKTSSAKFWREKEAAYMKAFGDELKEMVINANLLTREQAYGEEKHLKENRDLLKRVGTDLVREQIDQDFWVKKMEERLDALESMNKRDILIHDVRFRNEAEMIKRRRGVLVLVQRPGLDSNDSHRSETEFQSITPDYYLVNEGSLDDLRLLVIGLMKKIKRDLNVDNEYLSFSKTYGAGRAGSEGIEGTAGKGSEVN